jgi:hypothetical protein
MQMGINQSGEGLNSTLCLSWVLCPTPVQISGSWAFRLGLELTLLTPLGLRPLVWAEATLLASLVSILLSVSMIL